MTVAKPSLQLNRRTALYVSLGLLILLVVGLVVWSWYSRQNYQQQVQTNQAQLQQLLDKANTNPQLQTDTAGNYLSILNSQVLSLADQLPDPPRLLSASLLSTDQQQQLTNIKAAYHQLDQQLQTSAQLASYQSQITPTLAKLKQGQGENAEQQTALAKTWQQAHQDLANIIVPQVSQNFSQKLLQTIDDISQDLTDLSQLYQKADQTAFLNLKQQLADKFATFDQLAEDHQSLVEQQDQQLQQALDRLLQAY